MQKTLLFLIICLFPFVTWADERTLTGVEYWIDDGHQNRTTVNIGSDGLLQFMLDTGMLKEGLHTLHYRAQDSEGYYSPLQSWLFYRQQLSSEVATEVVALEYWTDNRYDLMKRDMVSGNEIQFTLDASALTEGLHSLNYRTQDDQGHYSPTQQWMFYRNLSATFGGNIFEYWIDEGEHLSRNANESDVTFVLDASAMEEGLHTLHYQLKDESGRVSAQQSWMFYRIASQPKATALKWYRIWWNGHEDKAIEVQLPEGTTEFLYEETLSVPEYALNDGYSRDNTARFHIVFCDDQGQMSPLETDVVSYPDLYPPVTTLNVIKDNDCAKLSWQANADDIRDYNVYYSENGEPYILWKSNVQQLEATFKGQQGKTYRFIVTSRDVNGNYEALEESKAKEITF